MPLIKLDMQGHRTDSMKLKGQTYHESYFAPMTKELIMWYAMTLVLIAWGLIPD